MTKPFATRYFLALAAMALLPGALAAVSAPAAAAHQPEPADRFSYVLMSADGRSSTMSGSMEDMRLAKSHKAGDAGLLYVRQSGVAYVIRDAATLRQAHAIFAPQNALGRQQGELGKRQAALGRRQAQLGAEQGRLGRQQADASPRQAGELGRQQGELGRRQAVLGREQAALGTEQGALGREQARLARIAQEQLRALVAEAVRSGVAQRVG
jgi:hypothetical protein